MPVSFVERIGARTIVHLGQGESAVKTVFDNDVGLAIGDTAIVAPAPRQCVSSMRPVAWPSKVGG